jgi:hypothetical protein
MIVTKMTLSLFYSHKKRDYLKIVRRQGPPFENPKIDDEKGKKEKIEKADAAMDQYLNRDDGGDDWLGLMNDLLHEE